jgi:predicted RNA-binding Zn-ribbon protein involved in translation (DUF1610 family)
MRCPRCGSPMNHHADKLIEDPAGEVTASIYCCPTCGKVESEVQPAE